MKIAGLFPTRTAMSPTDADAYFDAPDMFTPRYDEVHVSVVFGWDKRKAFQMARAWRGYGKVRFGGPAFGDPGREFVPGRYVAPGVTFTSRGCPKRCGPCFVARREGGLREFEEKAQEMARRVVGEALGMVEGGGK